MVKRLIEWFKSEQKAKRSAVRDDRHSQINGRHLALPTQNGLLRDQ
jgi:hypothetical protein